MVSGGETEATQDPEVWGVVVDVLRAEDVPGVLALLRTHLRLIPSPALSDHEMLEVLGNPDWFSVHYETEAEPSKDQVISLVAKQGDEVIGATQVIFPDGDKSAYILWIVGLKDQVGLTRLCTAIKEQAYLRGCQSIGDTRNPFGIGWAGIPSYWSHVLDALQANGFDESERWQSYWIDRIPHNGQFGERLDTNPSFDEARGELTVSAYKSGQKVGEVEIWFPPPFLGAFFSAGMVNLEWVEVEKGFRRQGIGQALLQAAMMHAADLGARRFMLWTETGTVENNVPMQRLAVKLGFQKGPILSWMKCSLPPA